MTYRTKTYVAGDWTNDLNAIDQLYKWNNSNYWGLSFLDAHELTQAKDSSLNCSIKKSLKQRLDVSKTFILIVGNKTDSLTAGSCRYCTSYNAWSLSCNRGNSIDYRSYIKYECEKAIEAKMNIVVLYNSLFVTKSLCPESIRDIGTHVAMVHRRNDGTYEWDYNTVKNAIYNE